MSALSCILRDSQLESRFCLLVSNSVVIILAKNLEKWDVLFIVDYALAFFCGIISPQM